MSDGGGEHFFGVKEDVASANAAESPESCIKKSMSANAKSQVLDLPEAKDLGIKNSTVTCSGEMADGDGPTCQAAEGRVLAVALAASSNGASKASNLGIGLEPRPSSELEAVAGIVNAGSGMAADNAKNAVLDLSESEAQDLSIKNSTCQGAEEDGVASAKEVSEASGVGIGLEQPRPLELEAVVAMADASDGTMSNNAKNAVLDLLNAQQHGIKSSKPCDGIADSEKKHSSEATAEVAKTRNGRPLSSFRPPSRSRKKRRPERFIAKEESSEGGTTSVNAETYVLDTYLSSRLNNSSEAIPEMADHITADWILDERGDEAFKIRDVTHYVACLRQLRASATEPGDTSGANDPSTSAGLGSALPSTSAAEPPADPKEGAEDGVTAPDASGMRSSSHLMVLGASLACAAIVCALFFFFGQRAETDLSDKLQE